MVLSADDCFQVTFPPLARLNNLSYPERELVMRAKLSCYHTWLFYYLYSADFKLIKAIFSLKFDFAKVLFARDFSVLFR